MVKAGQSNASSGVALCRTPDEVIWAFDKFSCRATSVTAQRYYAGPTYLAGGLFQRGEAVHFYAGKQISMWPPLIGYSCEVRSVGDPHLSILMQAAETVCKNLEWTGLAAFDFVLDEDGQFRFVDFNPRIWGSASAAMAAKVDLYGGIDRLMRGEDAGPPSRSIPGITHRVFPKYTLKPSGASMWRRLAGLRFAPWDTPFLVASELVLQTALNVVHSLDKRRERHWAAP
jgi:hypothetical protein